ncbi:hypothetical protein M405DRAFT_834345 [Rhizopogon salebrosus TDB-379]|nr:hypothetical protein M405DRAFT_834345 [Rhizopogon salebrosus TDB-379]
MPHRARPRTLPPPPQVPIQTATPPPNLPSTLMKGSSISTKNSISRLSSPLPSGLPHSCTPSIPSPTP